MSALLCGGSSHGDLNSYAQFRSGWPPVEEASSFEPVMPFPVAHPAAILPLRRYCPRYLSFPALIAGSLSPDFGYLLSDRQMDRFSHRFWAGSFGFCLPTGLLLVLLFYVLRSPTVKMLPARWQEVLLPPCRSPAGSLFPIMVSVLIGAWTHIVLDSITHGDGWLVERLAFLQSTLPWAGNRRLAVYAALYAGCTFAGAAWVAIHYLRWLERCLGAPGLRRPGRKWSWALSFAGGILLVAEASREPSQMIGIIPAGLMTVLLVVGFVGATGSGLAARGQRAAGLGPNAPSPQKNAKPAKEE